MCYSSPHNCESSTHQRHVSGESRRIHIIIIISRIHMLCFCCTVGGLSCNVSTVVWKCAEACCGSCTCTSEGCNPSQTSSPVVHKRQAGCNNMRGQSCGTQQGCPNMLCTFTCTTVVIGTPFATLLQCLSVTGPSSGEPATTTGVDMRFPGILL
jgi:hypothetical protein